MIGRRTLLAGSLGGLLFGLTGVALLRNDSSIRFIGRRQTIIALLDTTTERVLFVLGERDDELLAYIAGLTTVGNARIDLVVASHRVLATRAAREHLNAGTVPTLVLQMSGSMPPIRGNVTNISGGTTLDLGGKALMEIDVTGTEADHPDFLVNIDIRGNQLQLASSEYSLRMSEIGNPTLLALPGSAAGVERLNISPEVLVCNAPNPDLANRQVEVFASDPSIVQIGEGSLTIREDQLSS